MSPHGRLAIMDAIATHEDEKISQISYVVYSTLFGEPTKHQKRMRELGEVLSAYPPHLLNRVHTELTEVEEDLANDLVLILSSPDNDPVAVDEYIAFSPSVTKIYSLDLIRKMVRPLHSYSQLPAMVNYAEAPQHVRAQISGLLHVVSCLFHANSVSYNEKYPLVVDKGTIMLEGDSLIRLVVAYPSKADLIATTIINRDIKDVALIRAIITSDSPSISEGTL